MVKVQVTNQEGELTVKRQDTGRTINVRTDGYYHCDVDGLYTFRLQVNDDVYSCDVVFFPEDDNTIVVKTIRTDDNV